MKVSAVSKAFGDIAVLQDISFTVESPQVISLLGPSGCGKTTLLRILAGLERPSHGHIERAQNQRQSFVFQESVLLPWRNAFDNTILPLELSGHPAPQSRVTKALDDLGLSQALHRYPHQLSGGMKMRVSLARALVTEPEIIFMDEPFASLDELTRHRLNKELRSLAVERRLTIFFVTHSISEALFLSDRILILNQSPGRIVNDYALDAPGMRQSDFRDSALFLRSRRELEAPLQSGSASS